MRPATFGSAMMAAGRSHALDGWGEGCASVDPHPAIAPSKATKVRRSRVFAPYGVAVGIVLHAARNRQVRSLLSRPRFETVPSPVMLPERPTGIARGDQGADRRFGPDVNQAAMLPSS